MFLTEYLNGISGQVCALHEPWPARWELVISNLRNRTGLGHAALRRVLHVTRARRLKNAQSSAVIEVNPLLCPGVDLLPEFVDPLVVVHVVRDPVSWAGSMLGFKASGWRRPLIDHVPFAKPYPPDRPAGWVNMSEAEKCLWRWRFCNERIRALQFPACQYTVLRYEDLFSGDATVRESSFRTLKVGLGLDPDAGTGPDVSIRVNRRSDTYVLPSNFPEMARRICGPLAETWGYGPH